MVEVKIETEYEQELSAQNICRVQRALATNGAVSSRRNGCGLHRSSFSRITRLEIRFHPYVLIRKQELRLVEPPQHLELHSATTPIKILDS